MFRIPPEKSEDLATRSFFPIVVFHTTYRYLICLFLLCHAKLLPAGQVRCTILILPPDRSFERAVNCFFVPGSMEKCEVFPVPLCWSRMFPLSLPHPPGDLLSDLDYQNPPSKILAMVVAL